MPSKAKRRTDQALACGWCGRTFPLAALGRPPKWCSQSCRQRAWEQRRAAQSGRVAVDVVVQLVEVEKPVRVTVIERVEVPTVPTGRAWPALLAELIDQLDRGRVYDRDLVELTAAIENVLRALERRPAFQRLARPGPRRRLTRRL